MMVCGRIVFWAVARLTQSWRACKTPVKVPWRHPLPPLAHLRAQRVSRCPLQKTWASVTTVQNRQVSTNILGTGQPAATSNPQIRRVISCRQNVKTLVSPIPPMACSVPQEKSVVWQLTITTPGNKTRMPPSTWATSTSASPRSCSRSS
jgi:hypothetical protein